MATPPIILTGMEENISSRFVLLCEGGGDKNFFEELIRVRSLPSFYVTHPRMSIDPGGRSGFTSRLRGLRLQHGFDRIKGIIVASDNDRDPAASFKEVRGQIHEAEYKAPNHPFTVSAGTPAVSIMMVPGADLGQLETLCLEAIEDEWPKEFACASTYAACVGTEKWPNVGKRERAKLRALVSHICQKDPNSSLSHLWHDKRELVIPLTHKCFDPISTYLSGFEAAVAEAS